MSEKAPTPPIAFASSRSATGAADIHVAFLSLGCALTYWNFLVHVFG